MIFRYTILYVEDVEATMAFYQKAFGFEIIFIHEGKDYGELNTGETKLAFASLELMSTIGKNPSKASATGPCFELAFETDDVAGDLKTAVDAGATLVQDVQEQPWGQTISYVSDPNGFLIEICSKVEAPEGS